MLALGSLQKKQMVYLITVNLLINVVWSFSLPCIEGALKKMSKRSKYADLVKNGIISEEDLNSAISKASSENNDIENIFLNEMKLSREDIGKSLEHFYNFPYQMYDGSNLPDSMFSGLNKNFLRRNNWVPLADEKDTAIILIDDPSDEDKIDNIPQKFSKKKI